MAKWLLVIDIQPIADAIPILEPGHWNSVVLIQRFAVDCEKPNSAAWLVVADPWTKWRFFMGKTSSRNCILMSPCQDTSFTYIYIAVNGMKRNAPRSVKMNMVWFSACWDPAKRWQGKEKAGTGVVLPRLHDQQLKEYCNEESPTTWNIVTPVKEVWKNK